MKLSADIHTLIKNEIDLLPWHSTRRWGNRSIDLIKEIIVHQSLCDASVLNINHYHITPAEDNHISKLGAPHICYHFGIEKSGKIIQCNELKDVVWHTKGQNMISIGILVCGDFDGPTYEGKNIPTDNQLKSLKILLDYITNKLNINKSEVYGHKDFGKENCPGNIIMEVLENYKS